MQPTKEDLLSPALAARAGFFSVPCPSCDGAVAICSNCGGRGRVWTEGVATLDDAGMTRLLETLCMPARPVAFATRLI